MNKFASYLMMGKIATLPFFINQGKVSGECFNVNTIFPPANSGIEMRLMEVESSFLHDGIPVDYVQHLCADCPSPIEGEGGDSYGAAANILLPGAACSDQAIQDMDVTVTGIDTDRETLYLLSSRSKVPPDTYSQYPGLRIDLANFQVLNQFDLNNDNDVFSGNTVKAFGIRTSVNVESLGLIPGETIYMQAATIDQETGETRVSELDEIIVGTQDCYGGGGY